MHLVCFNAVDRKIARKCFLDGSKIGNYLVDAECFQRAHRVCDEEKKKRKKISRIRDRSWKFMIS